MNLFTLDFQLLLGVSTLGVILTLIDSSMKILLIIFLTLVALSGIGLFLMHIAPEVDGNGNVIDDDDE